MIISRYDEGALGEAFGIGFTSIDAGIGAGWARVPPGGCSDPHQHDETEMFVVVQGSGEVRADGKRYRVSPGSVVRFEPFETHVIENTDATDLVFVNVCWRDLASAVRSASRPVRRRFDERPLFVFSTPPTPNGDLHLGHLCGPYLGADVYVRFQRMNGASAWHITGTDDFQSYVAACARRDGQEAGQTAARNSAEIIATLKLMDIAPDAFTATSTAPGYQQGVRAFFARVVASDAVRARELPALFDPDTGAYLFEVDVAGGCPGCGNSTSGGICEDCGEPNTGVDLVDAEVAASGRPPRRGTLTQLAVPMHELAGVIAAHQHQGRVPARIRDVAARVFSRPNLDMGITHPLPWGLTVDEAAVEGQVIWAIVDVAYSLLFGIEALGRQIGKDWRADAPQADWKIVQFFGFDNTFYNAITVPIFYHLAHPDWKPDVDYNLNEFYHFEHSKFSTSRRHGIWGKEILGSHNSDAVRLFLARTRPEGRRTNFEVDAYDAFVRDTLVGGWQSWLNELGQRVEASYGGVAPDAGIWTPEQTAFLARMDARRSALAASLGPDGFSLNRGAEELLGIVEDTIRFVRTERPVAQTGAWQSETRTAVALELAAAKLLAAVATPIMPRFAAELAAALGQPGAAQWPHTVDLVAPGTAIDLAGRTFFGQPAAEPELRTWLSDLARAALGLPAVEVVTGRSLAALGMVSLQAVALQYQIFEKTGVEIMLEDLLGDRSLADLATMLASTTPASTTLASPAAPAGVSVPAGAAPA